MKKNKVYYSTRFTAQVVKEGHDLCLQLAGVKKVDSEPAFMNVSKGAVDWEYDRRAEFLAELATADNTHLYHDFKGGSFTHVFYSSNRTNVRVDLPTRADIESVFQVFEQHVDDSKVVTDRPLIKVFVGHGRNPQWRDLKDHLHEQHSLDVTAYEIGPRAGMSVKEVLQEMLADSSFALLVLTGEDMHADGELHARENVIHEVGLFQGRLGFLRAILLLEDGVGEFSNILGVNQIRFAKGRIRETFGDVLATIKREFEDNDN